MKHPCPCCGYSTLPHPANGTFAICPVCFWEDDGAQLDDPDYEIGANPTSLRKAQENFKQFGACDEGMLPYVRPAAAVNPNKIHKMAELTFQVLLEGKKIGTSALEKADTPMGVVFGRLLLSNIPDGYTFFKNYCIEKMIGMTDYPESLLISTRNIPGLQVFNPMGTEIKGMSASVSGQGEDDFEITLEGIPAGLFYAEFTHHVASYQKTLEQSVRQDDIKEIGIDPVKRLYLKPANEKFPLIYHTATEVHWDDQGQFLFSPAELKGWSYVEWYKHIIGVVAMECSCRLMLTDETRWLNIPEDLKRQMYESNQVESIKRYEILESLPAYGPMYIPITESGEPFYSEGFVVRFNKTDNTQWIANFQTGWTDLKGIFELRGNVHLLVIAGGTGYLMNPDQEKPLAVFGVGYTTVLTAKDGRLILIDVTDCTIVELNGTFWHTERISWDGIKGAQLTDNIISGLACNPTHAADEWVSFSYNIDTKELLGGSYPKSEKNQKSKWKFWR